AWAGPVDPRADGTARRHSHGALAAGGGHRGGADRAGHRRHRAHSCCTGRRCRSQPRRFARSCRYRQGACRRKGDFVSHPVKVFLVDDHALFRTGVKAELAGLDDDRIEVVGEAGSVGEAVVRISSDPPDVVLLDVHMPDGGGRAVLEQVHVALPDVVFLALSVSDAAEDVIAVIRAGARGYVTKTISGRELADAVHRVRAGDPVFSPRLAGFVLDAFSDRPGAAPPTDPELDRLTRRERDVLRLLARGYS